MLINFCEQWMALTWIVGAFFAGVTFHAWIILRTIIEPEKTEHKTKTKKKTSLQVFPLKK